MACAQRQQEIALIASAVTSRIANSLNNDCRLFGEYQPHHCHHRLVADYLHREWGDVEIEHLSLKEQL